jgi:hypothetical protein
MGLYPATQKAKYGIRTGGTTKCISIGICRISRFVLHLKICISSGIYNPARFPFAYLPLVEFYPTNRDIDLYAYRKNDHGVSTYPLDPSGYLLCVQELSLASKQFHATMMAGR